ncbi:MAG: lactate utilization protein [Planctomycetaceae bacterium]|jgi:L-lactate utilization protein LutB|nr:lactate utilization protein [Planctomycetaceae bacterium]
MPNISIEKRNDLLGVHVVHALKSRHFEAYYYKTSNEAVEKILQLIPRKESVSWGGSTTIEEIGLIKRLRADYDRALDRDQTTSIADRYEAMQKAFFCDNYLMSANAISEDGQLVNVDGNGNRVAAMAFGPKRVIVVAGINKVVKTLDDAMVRARTYASPINAQRVSSLDLKTPCIATGTCTDCKTADCICTYIVTTRISRPQGRIQVVLIGETLGF